MKTPFLFPHPLRKIGWVLFIPSLIAALLLSLFGVNTDNYLNVKVFALYQDNMQASPHWLSMIDNSISDELLTVLLIIGGLLICFSKLNNEDEYIAKIRYESLVWATYLNYGLIVLFTIFLYGIPYLNVLFYNMFTLIVFFIVRFHYQIYKLNKTASDDE